MIIEPNLMETFAVMHNLPYFAVVEDGLDHASSGSWLDFDMNFTQEDPWGLQDSSNLDEFATHTTNAVWFYAFFVRFVANATGQRGIRIITPNSGVIAESRMDASASGVTTLDATCVRNLTTNTLVRFEFFQDSGGTLSANEGTGAGILLRKGLA